MQHVEQQRIVPQERRRLTRGGAAARDARALAQALAAFPGFAVCSPGDLEVLAGAGRVISLPVRWAFLHEGTPADACWVLLDGEVQVQRAGVQVAVLGPGAVLGEMGLLGRSLRQATVVTLTGVQALRVENDVLVELLAESPGLADRLRAAYAQHRAADLARAGR